MTPKVASHIPRQGQGGTGGSQEKDHKASMAAAPQSSSRRRASGRMLSQTSHMQEVGEQRVYACAMCSGVWQAQLCSLVHHCLTSLSLVTKVPPSCTVGMHVLFFTCLPPHAFAAYPPPTLDKECHHLMLSSI